MEIPEQNAAEEMNDKEFLKRQPEEKTAEV